VGNANTKSKFKVNMHAAIYNPYLDTLGGGERYTISFAKVLSDVGYDVDVEWKNPKIKNKLEERFGIKLQGINFINDIKRGDGYDICFWLSDGSIPLLRARKNFLHFQFPFKDVKGGSLLNRMKLFRVSKIICNSRFTKSYIDKEYQSDSLVIYPPVDTKSIRPKRKENIILFVGRFSQLTQSKNQQILIDAFKSFYKSGPTDWRLILAGGIEVGVDDYMKKLVKSSRNYPVEIVKSPGYEEIKNLYGISKLFWSAVGYGVEEEKDPKKVEHFGIAVVEAMRAGAVPIVYNAGGHKEIIKDGDNGFLWSTKRELIKKTKDLIKDSKKLKLYSRNATKASLKYGYERFRKEILQLVEN